MDFIIVVAANIWFSNLINLLTSETVMCRDSFCWHGGLLTNFLANYIILESTEYLALAKHYNQSRRSGCFE